MNILIVSFDRVLVSKLKEVLKEYSVIEVKNVEEALSTAFPFIDIVIYDAVSGSISEEEINHMYRQKFRDAKYIILVDDLFPVDMGNITPPNKVKLLREEAVEKIMEALFKEEEGQREEAFELDKYIFEEIQPEMEQAYLEQKEWAKPEEEKLIYRGGKLLIVSFDKEIVDNIREALSTRVQILEAKTPKEAIEKAKEADIIIFDTISGMLAYRTLMDMSKDEKLREKPYILLLDELFTIDVDSIPLSEKYTFTRTNELSLAIQKIIELTEKGPVETLVEIPQEFLPVEEEPVLETEETTPPESEKSIMDLLEEVLSKEGFKAEEEVVQETPSKLPSEAPKGEDLINAIKDAIIDQLSQDKLYSILSQVINYEDLRAQISSSLEAKLEKTIEEKIQEIFSKIDIARIIREEAYRVLKERLREIIT